MKKKNCFIKCMLAMLLCAAVAGCGAFPSAASQEWRDPENPEDQEWRDPENPEDQEWRDPENPEDQEWRDPNKPDEQEWRDPANTQMYRLMTELWKDEICEYQYNPDGTIHSVEDRILDPDAPCAYTWTYEYYDSGALRMMSLQLSGDYFYDLTYPTGMTIYCDETGAFEEAEWFVDVAAYEDVDEDVPAFEIEVLGRREIMIDHFYDEGDIIYGVRCIFDESGANLTEREWTENGSVTGKLERTFNELGLPVETRRWSDSGYFEYTLAYVNDKNGYPRFSVRTFDDSSSYLMSALYYSDISALGETAPVGMEDQEITDLLNGFITSVRKNDLPAAMACFYRPRVEADRSLNTGIGGNDPAFGNEYLDIDITEIEQLQNNPGYTQGSEENLFWWAADEVAIYKVTAYLYTTLSRTKDDQIIFYVVADDAGEAGIWDIW